MNIASLIWADDLRHGKGMPEAEKSRRRRTENPWQPQRHCI